VEGEEEYLNPDEIVCVNSNDIGPLTMTEADAPNVDLNAYN
jgi:hypothetical protein